jgi:hypothetical protein
MARSPAGDGVVAVEQEWTTGIVLRLYERRAIGAENDLRAYSAAPTAAQRSAERPLSAPSAKPVLPGENLARYVNSLRVEISGPLAADSLARLLDAVE